MKRYSCWKVLLLAAPIAFAGCGGGGGGGAAPSRSGTLGVFVTDSPEDNYDHVWVKVHNVELVDSAGGVQTVFSDDAGRVFDLKALRDATGSRFALLGQVSAESGKMHSKVRVSFDDRITLVPKGSTSGQITPVDDSVARDTKGRPRIEFDLSSPRNLGSGAENLVVDFDLANFQIAGGKVKPAVKEGSKSGLDDSNRHEREDYEGVIQDLSGAAPNFRFSLAVGQGSGQALNVATDQNTVITNADASPSPTLANGKRVHVRGVLNVTNKTLTAAAIRIETEHTAEKDPAGVEGAPSAIDASAGTFKVTTREVHGFVPTGATVNVSTNAATAFRSHSGVLIDSTTFFARLAAAGGAEVAGTYDSATNTLTAIWAKLEDEPHQGGQQEREAKVLGAPKSADPAQGAFVLNPLGEFEGFVPVNNSVDVTTNGQTIFREKSVVITKQAFFAGFASAASIRVEGKYANGVFTAVVAKLVPMGDG